MVKNTIILMLEIMKILIMIWMLIMILMLAIMMIMMIFMTIVSTTAAPATAKRQQELRIWLSDELFPYNKITMKIENI